MIALLSVLAAIVLLVLWLRAEIGWAASVDESRRLRHELADARREVAAERRRRLRLMPNPPDRRRSVA